MFSSSDPAETPAQRAERLERLRAEVADGTYVVDRSRLAAYLAASNFLAR